MKRYGMFGEGKKAGVFGECSTKMCGVGEGGRITKASS